jgi:hypothetical protein
MCSIQYSLIVYLAGRDDSSTYIFLRLSLTSAILEAISLSIGGAMDVKAR